MSFRLAALAVTLALCLSLALSMVSPKPSGFANTKAGKTAILDRTKKLIQESSLIITIPIDGVSKEQVDMLRKVLPKSTKASVVKNSIMRIATGETPFAAMNTGKGIKGENMFFFIGEGNAKETYKAMKDWAKEVKRTEPQFLPKYGAMDGELFVNDRLDAVVNLPTRKELITKIAQGIKAVPTKVGRSVKAVPSKLGRAFGALKKKLEDDASA
jgi:large subunit ribosomal protein L10